MKSNERWYSGMGDWVILTLLFAVFIGDFIFIINGNWLFSVGFSAMPLFSVIDHILWNIEPSEDKFSMTHCGAGTKLFLKRVFHHGQ